MVGPVSVVAAGRGEVVPGGRARRPLVVDQRPEHLAGPVHHARIERAREHHDARAFQQRPGQFGLELPPAGFGGRPLGHFLPVDQDIVFNQVGTGIGGQVGGLLYFGPEVFEPGVAGGVPAAGRGRR